LYGGTRHRLRPATDQSRNERDDEQHDEYEEKDLRNFSRAGGYTAETEQCSDQGYNKKDEGITEHGGPRLKVDKGSGGLTACAGIEMFGFRLASRLFRRRGPILGFDDGRIATIGIFDPWWPRLRQQ